MNQKSEIFNAWLTESASRMDNAATKQEYLFWRDVYLSVYWQLGGIYE